MENKFEFEFEFKKIKNANNFNNAPFQKSKKTDIEFLTTKKKNSWKFLSKLETYTLILYTKTNKIFIECKRKVIFHISYKLFFLRTRHME